MSVTFLKSTFVLGILAAQAPAFAVEWTEVQNFEPGRRTFVDAASIVRIDSIRKVWTMSDWSKSRTVGSYKFSSVVQLDLYNWIYTIVQIGCLPPKQCIFILATEVPGRCQP